MSAQRLQSGGRIDRQQRIEFTWDDRSLRGYAGDSLASALLASNETVLGRPGAVNRAVYPARNKDFVAGNRHGMYQLQIP